MTPEEQLAGFIAKFDPAVAKLINAARKHLRKQFPSANELVYDNYNFLAMGLSATERASDTFVGLAAGSGGVALSFYYGASLPDPENILQGAGNQHRFVRIDKLDRLAEPAVQAVIEAAAATARTPLPKTGKGRLIIKSISAKQRPRR